MEQSRWQDIFLHLKEKGIDAYSPSTKIGECQEPYVVILDDGEIEVLGFSSTQHFYTVLCYVPQNGYSNLEPYVLKVESAMKELQPMIMPSRMKTTSYYDDYIKAHMVSIQYHNYRKN